MATSEPSQELNLPHLLEVLNRNNVEYILVGSMAAVIQGAPYATYDVDMIVKHSDQNLDRTAVALQELGARQIAGLQALEEGPPPTSGADLARHLSMFNTNAGRVDVLRQGVVIGRYEDIGPRALGYVIDGQTVFVADLQSIIADKEARSQPKDRAQLHDLYRLADELGMPLTKEQRRVLAGEQHFIDKPALRPEIDLVRQNYDEGQHRAPEPEHDHDHGYDR